MSNIQENLTIIIPTYNREKRLIKMLESIAKQDSRIKIKIIDNNSNYDVESTIKNKFPTLSIEIIKNKANIGMIGNISKCFYECDTKWMWLLSDDDEILENAFINIEEEIKKYPEVAYFKFSIDGIGINGEEKPEKVETLEEFIDHYYNDPISKGGQMVFMSNNLFNMKILNKYLGEIYTYSYIYVPHLIPVFFGLANKEIQAIFSDKKIVRYLPPDGDHWNILKVILGVSTISHLPLNLNKEYIRRFIKIFNWINMDCAFTSILKTKNKNAVFYFSNLYHSLYKYNFKIKDKIKYRIYKIVLYINLNTKFDLYNFLRTIKRKFSFK